MVVSGNQKFLQTTEHIFRYISSVLVLSCNDCLLVMVFFSIPIFHYCSIICTNLYYRYDYIFRFFPQMLLLLIIEHLHMVPYNIKIDSCSTKKDQIGHDPKRFLKLSNNNIYILEYGTVPQGNNEIIKSVTKNNNPISSCSTVSSKKNTDK